MDTSAAVLQLIEDLCAHFPGACEHAKKRVEDLGYDPDAYGAFLEQFANVTTAAMRAFDECTVREHLDFMSVRFDRGDPKVKECIDVCYVETLMWDLNAEAKKWAWKLMPKNLKELYVRMWGEQRF